MFSDSEEEDTIHNESDISVEEQENQRMKDLMNPEYSWYIVNTYSGSEEKVKVQLQQRIQHLELEDLFGEIYIPKISKEKVLKSGKRKLIEKTSFPGYILVQMKLSDRSMSCVNSISKVAGFVGDKKSPKAMKDVEVLRLIESSRKMNAAPKEVIAAFKQGDAVKVTDGPFTNFDGVVEEVKPEKMKLKVLVSIFGRETPLELTYEQVKKQE
jgi:transcription termination/antitermination protein NusG